LYVLTNRQKRTQCDLMNHENIYIHSAFMAKNTRVLII